ncbi:hypothetical protein [Pedobacter sp. GR22-10]|uniref:hypothetical protein n=1 Tax=Pedobacter sp. GR22-10 TaxID=2994472 RepID=UPI0022481A81|nr:hypothetical protein [Pedobacter sp. GR22-10]MCX2429893.1 hypothetical protein [Pedobacter sp. GR22-10]
MENTKVKRTYGSAEFAGSGKGYGLKVGKRYRMGIAHLVDSGSLQLHLDEGDSFLFIDYNSQNDFDAEWKAFEKISKRLFFETNPRL